MQFGSENVTQYDMEAKQYNNSTILLLALLSKIHMKALIGEEARQCVSEDKVIPKDDLERAAK